MDKNHHPSGTIEITNILRILKLSQEIGPSDVVLHISVSTDPFRRITFRLLHYFSAFIQRRQSYFYLHSGKLSHNVCKEPPRGLAIFSHCVRHMTGWSGIEMESSMCPARGL